MNAYIFKRLVYCLTWAAYSVQIARCGARGRYWRIEATSGNQKLIDLCRAELRRRARQAVKYARAALLILTAETLRKNYQFELLLY